MLAAANGFKMFNALAASYTLNYLVFLLKAVGRNQSCDWLPDNLVGQITKDSLCSLIPSGDYAV